MKKIKQFMKKQGFTLVELIIVIAIIAVLAVSAFMMLTKWLGNSRDSRRLGDLKTIQTGLEVGYLDEDMGNGLYPMPGIGENGGAVILLYSGNDTEKFAYQGVVDLEVSKSANLQRVPLDPSEKNEYTYLVTNNRKKFQLMAMLEDDIEVTVMGDNVYALDYKNRYPIVAGYSLGVFLTKDTNIPIQYVGTSLTGINIMDDTEIGNYKAKVKEGENAVEGTGIQDLEIYTETTEDTGTIIIYSCQGGLEIANADITNTTGLTVNTDYQNTELGDDCYYVCKTNYSGINCETYTAPLVCATGFIKVPGNAIFNTNDFCIAVYEMSYEGETAINSRETTAYSGSKNSLLTSKSGELAITNITQQQAIDSCVSLGTGYHLITNNEWMTVARDIEAQASNWSNGSVGSGHIWNGLSKDISLGCDGKGDDDTWAEKTGRTGCGEENRNKQILSNGEEIWDLAGNIREHVNKANTIDGTDYNVGININISATNNAWGEWNVSTTDSDGYGPIIALDSTDGIGRIYQADGTIFMRGGCASGGANGGIFGLDLNRTSVDHYNSIGFRCTK